MDPVKLPWQRTFDNGYEEHWGATTQIGVFHFWYIYKKYEFWGTDPQRRKVGDCGCGFRENESFDVTGCTSVDDLKALAEKVYYDKTHEFSGDIFECPKAWVKSVLLPELGGTTANITIEVPNGIEWNVGITGSGRVVPLQEKSSD